MIFALGKDEPIYGRRFPVRYPAGCVERTSFDDLELRLMEVDRVRVRSRVYYSPYLDCVKCWKISYGL